jgi:hypothetical protein
MAEREPLIRELPVERGRCNCASTRTGIIVLLTSTGAGIAISAGVNLGTNFATGAPVLAALTGAAIFALTTLAILVVFERLRPNNDKVVGGHDHWMGDFHLAGELVAVAGVCEGLQLFFHNEFCGQLFRCGCVWQWKGGWKDCNVHNPVGRPKCPWCIARTYTSWTTDSLILALMVLSYANAHRLPEYLFSSPWLRWAVPWRLCLPVAVFFTAGFVVALAFSWASPSYPYFLVGQIHSKDSD